ncbi:hypothetical protein B0H67DRAFT_642456 [Lasiosphaeris hirsuta]|uniref:Uncharacterized protein n=1 Tax=Lasiosphaeris hirsuta TaxID=260670 RepID=A0AA40E8A9_9PEZI|nr:hypothetical protein B0H67DRAFT_642456 [Lasiosphaeris hirsuta]
MAASSTSLKHSKRLKRTTLITSVLFGGQPTDLPTVSQGSIFHYKDSACSWSQRLTENAAPLLLPDSCKPIPSSDILSVSINSLPECPQYGQPLLVLYDGPDCRSVNAGPAEVGVVGVCQTLENKRDNSNSNSSSGVSTAVNIRSAQWICTPRGVESVPGTETETMMYTNQPTANTVNTAASGGSSSACCECCCNGCCKCGCVVM